MTYKPRTEHVISSANSTAALLTGGATFTGAWEDVTDYTTVAATILGSLATDGTLYFDISTDGGTTSTSVPATVADATFAVPRILNVVESHVRIRYVNGTTAQTGTFSVQTKYSNAQPIALLSAVDGLVREESPTQLVRSVVAGKKPDGTYSNARVGGEAFQTTSVLADAAIYDSGLIALDDYSQMATEVLASHDGHLEFLFYSDSAGTDLVRSVTLPYIAAEGYQYYAAPAFGHYGKWKFTNNSGSLQTDFYFATSLHPSALSPQILDTTGVIAPQMTTMLTRPTADFNEQRNESHILAQESKRQFGTNNAVGNALETVWSYTADWVPNQTFNEKLRIKAGGNAADGVAGAGAQTVEVIFLDDSWNEITETIVTAGASASTATTANCVRLLGAKVLTVGTYHGANTAAITFELTGGNIMGYIAAGVGTSEQAILTVPAGKTAYITDILVSVGQGDSCDIKMFDVQDASDITTPFSGKHEDWAISDFSGAQMFQLHTFLKFNAKQDIWFEAERITGAGSARVSIDFSYYLVDD